eukprot:TRINITY_DN6413_c1_g1_i1.p1 TRINITY_DN6413_c1_g1~~TRINITY_DN6413_c1_g1_i1.p1  ORF type:complete len:408 (+),score=82.60 TRINITY_DN6413_c1_g1_i1:64-1224(+)
MLPEIAKGIPFQLRSALSRPTFGKEATWAWREYCETWMKNRCSTNPREAFEFVTNNGCAKAGVVLSDTTMSYMVNSMHHSMNPRNATKHDDMRRHLHEIIDYSKERHRAGTSTYENYIKCMKPRQPNPNNSMFYNANMEILEAMVYDAALPKPTTVHFATVMRNLNSMGYPDVLVVCNELQRMMEMLKIEPDVLFTTERHVSQVRMLHSVDALIEEHNQLAHLSFPPEYYVKIGQVLNRLNTSASQQWSDFCKSRDIVFAGKNAVHLFVTCKTGAEVVKLAEAEVKKEREAGVVQLYSKALERLFQLDLFGDFLIFYKKWVQVCPALRHHPRRAYEFVRAAHKIVISNNSPTKQLLHSAQAVIRPFSAQVPYEIKRLLEDIDRRCS